MKGTKQRYDGNREGERREEGPSNSGPLYWCCPVCLVPPGFFLFFCPSIHSLARHCTTAGRPPRIRAACDWPSLSLSPLVLGSNGAENVENVGVKQLTRHNDTRCSPLQEMDGLQAQRHFNPEGRG